MPKYRKIAHYVQRNHVLFLPFLEVTFPCTQYYIVCNMAAPSKSQLLVGTLMKPPALNCAVISLLIFPAFHVPRQDLS